MAKDNHVWSTADLNDEFRIEYDIIVNQEILDSWKSLFRITTGENTGEGGRIPAVFLNPSKSLYNCYHVNGDTNYCHSYDYELNTDYHFEMSQQRNPNGEAVYRIFVNGELLHEIINTTPLKFQDVKLFLSDPWYDSFAPFGKLSNLKIISDLTKLSKYKVDLIGCMDKKQTGFD